MNLEDFISSLSPELQEKARKCGSIDELLSLAEEEKVELPAEMLESIAGGQGQSPKNCNKPKCPKCGSKNTVKTYKEPIKCPWSIEYLKCKDCGYEWR